MKIKVIIVGSNPKHSYALKGMEEYLKRLKRYTKLSLINVKDGKDADVLSRILEASADHYKVVLDERGHLLSTPDFAKKVSAWVDDPGIKNLSFIIGASDGHSQELRDRADFLLSLSPLTMMHELALVVLLEQVYRAFTIRNGEPYHR